MSKLIRKIYLRRGNGEAVMEGNLRDLLEELWRIAQNGIVEDFQFETCKTRYRKHLGYLAERGCVELVFSSGTRGKPGIARIRLLLQELKPLAPEHRSDSRRDTQPAPVRTHFKVPEGFMLVRKPEVVEEDPRNHAFVFIDGANLAGEAMYARALRRMDALPVSRTRRLRDEHIDWRGFFKFIEQGYEGRGWLYLKKTFLFTHISSKLPDGIRDDIKQKLNRAVLGTNVELLLYPKENVDPGLAGKMGSIITRALLQGKTKKITIVLVSGDGDYAGTLEDIKSIAREEGKSLRVWVFGWNGCIADGLRKQADYITYLQDIAHILDRDAAEHLEAERRLIANMDA